MKKSKSKSKNTVKAKYKPNWPIRLKIPKGAYISNTTGNWLGES